MSCVFFSDPWHISSMYTCWIIGGILFSRKNGKYLRTGLYSWLSGVLACQPVLRLLNHDLVCVCYLNCWSDYWLDFLCIICVLEPVFVMNVSFCIRGVSIFLLVHLSDTYAELSVILMIVCLPHKEVCLRGRFLFRTVNHRYGCCPGESSQMMNTNTRYTFLRIWTHAFTMNLVNRKMQFQYHF